MGTMTLYIPKSMIKFAFLNSLVNQAAVILDRGSLTLKRINRLADLERNKAMHLPIRI